MRTRVIGLGNTILTDDRVGIAVARELARRSGAGDLDVVEAEVAGFALLEMMVGWDAVVLVDAVQFGDLEAGDVVRVDPADLRTSLRIRSVHEIDLPTVIALGRRLGLPMPDVVLVFGIQAEDTHTFGEALTPRVAAVVPQVADEVLRAVALLRDAAA